MADVDSLFDEYARAYARGETPRAREYLERAGPAADELAGLINRLLVAAPAPEPDAKSLERVAALASSEPGLADLRVRRGLRVDEVVAALVERLGLAPATRAKVKRYYEQLERGLLDPLGVSHRVFSALGAVLGADAWAYAGRMPPKPKLAQAHFRVLEATAAPAPAVPAAAGKAEEDEIDRLFTGGD